LIINVRRRADKNVSVTAGGVLVLKSSLRHLCVLCVLCDSAVNLCAKAINRRDAENAENAKIAQS